MPPPCLSLFRLPAPQVSGEPLAPAGRFERSGAMAGYSLVPLGLLGASGDPSGDAGHVAHGGASGGQAYGASCGPVSVGCLPTELVLRGGYLKEPVVVSDLLVFEGLQYVTLYKVAPVLNKFLAGLASCKRPLAKSLLFETLAAKRNELIEEKKRSVQAGGMAAIFGDTTDLAAGLGLDDGASEPPSAKKARRRHVPVKRVIELLPETAVVTLERPGQTWEVRMLLESRTKAPSVEATAENFAAMFEWVQAEFEGGSSRRRKHGASEPPVREPRGQKGAREYLVRNKWVKKVAAPEAAPARRPYSQGFRTLKRRRSDEPAAAARKRSAIDSVLTDGLASDCLDDCLADGSL